MILFPSTETRNEKLSVFAPPPVTEQGGASRDSWKGCDGGSLRPLDASAEGSGGTGTLAVSSICRGLGPGKTFRDPRLPWLDATSIRPPSPGAG